MTTVAATLEKYFTDRLLRQRQVSPQTVASYRDSLQLLLHFVHDQCGKEPSQLDWTDLDEPVISAFLDHLQDVRGNSVPTRNLRLTAIRGLFRYGAFHHPEHAALIQRVLAIPAKRANKPTLTFLTADESAALIDAPDRTRWEGRRDHTWLALAIQTGLRVSELTGLNCSEITLGVAARLECEGKGRKHRALPLTNSSQQVLKTWMTERVGAPSDPLFPTRTGRRLSRDAIGQRLQVYAAAAAEACPSLAGKRLHPHVLRHTCAVALLHAGVDTSVIALWLGHADLRSTSPYLHADMTTKEKALAITAQPTVTPGRYRPSDTVLAFLESL